MSDQTPKPSATCERCGQPVNVKRAKARRCTAKCRRNGVRIIRARVKTSPRTCNSCGKNFAAFAPHAKYCSPKCKRAGYTAKRAARIAALGGRCAIAGCPEDGSFRSWYIYETDDGTLLLCARHHSKRSQAKFYIASGWPKGKKGYVQSLREQE